MELVLLFGSQARGNAGPKSDFDVGILFHPDANEEFQRLEQVRAALGGGDQLDLVCLNDANALLLREAALDGIVQFENAPGTVERFRLRAHKRYMDTARFRRLQREALDAIYS